MKQSMFEDLNYKFIGFYPWFFMQNTDYSANFAKILF